MVAPLPSRALRLTPHELRGLNMQTEDRVQLLYRAQDNVLAWRFRMVTATKNGDQIGCRRAQAYLNFWAAQVARLVGSVPLDHINVGASVEPPCDTVC